MQAGKGTGSHSSDPLIDRYQVIGREEESVGLVLSQDGRYLTVDGGPPGFFTFGNPQTL